MQNNLGALAAMAVLAGRSPAPIRTQNPEPKRLSPIERQQALAKKKRRAKVKAGRKAAHRN